MKIAHINLNKGTLKTSKGNAEIDNTFSIIAELNRKEYTHIYFTYDKTPSRDVCDILDYALYKNFFVFLNDREISDTVIKEYSAKRYSENLFKDYATQRFKVTQIVLQNAELLPYYRVNNEVLYNHLQQYIIDSNYDVGLSSTTHYDKPQHTKYKDQEYHYTYVRHAQKAEQTLLDLLLQYINIKYYISVGFEPERKQRDENTPTVLPLSACSLGVSMHLYSD